MRRQGRHCLELGRSIFCIHLTSHMWVKWCSHKKELEMWKRLSGECSGSYCDVVWSISVDGVWSVCGCAFRKLISSSLEQLVHSNFSLQSGGSKSPRKFIDQSRKECFAKFPHKSNGIASAAAAAAVVSVPIQWALATPDRAAFSLCIYAHNWRMWGLWWFHFSLVLELNLGMQRVSNLGMICNIITCPSAKLGSSWCILL